MVCTWIWWSWDYQMTSFTTSCGELHLPVPPDQPATDPPSAASWFLFFWSEMVGTHAWALSFQNNNDNNTTTNNNNNNKKNNNNNRDRGRSIRANNEWHCQMTQPHVTPCSAKSKAHRKESWTAASFRCAASQRKHPSKLRVNWYFQTGTSIVPKEPQHEPLVYGGDLSDGYHLLTHLHPKRLEYRLPCVMPVSGKGAGLASLEATA